MIKPITPQELTMRDKEVPQKSIAILNEMIAKRWSDTEPIRISEHDMKTVTDTPYHLSPPDWVHNLLKIYEKSGWVITIEAAQSEFSQFHYVFSKP